MAYLRARSLRELKIFIVCHATPNSFPQSGFPLQHAVNRESLTDAAINGKSSEDGSMGEVPQYISHVFQILRKHKAIVFYIIVDSFIGSKCVEV